MAAGSCIQLRLGCCWPASWAGCQASLLGTHASCLKAHHNLPRTWYSVNNWAVVSIMEAAACFITDVAICVVDPWACCLLACCFVLQLNVVSFSVAGLGMLSGSLSVKASYEPATDTRVDIKFIESTLVSATPKKPEPQLPTATQACSCYPPCKLALSIAMHLTGLVHEAGVLSCTVSVTVSRCFSIMA